MDLIFSPSPSAEWNGYFSQVPLLNEIDTFLTSLCWMKFLFLMHAVICRRLERFSNYIPYPPQPYLLTCPQVSEISICKTFEAEK
jgi:hypothetical protein